MKKIANIKYLEPHSKYIEFEYDGMCFYIHPLEPYWAYALDNPEIMLLIRKIDLKKKNIEIGQKIFF